MNEGFDETIHAPYRLRICAFLDAASSAEFGALRDMLGVADSVMSKHLKVLQDAGHIAMSKPTGRGRVKTWVSLTPSGREAYHQHVAVLRAMFAAAGSTEAASESDEPAASRLGEDAGGIPG